MGLTTNSMRKMKSHQCQQLAEAPNRATSSNRGASRLRFDTAHDLQHSTAPPQLVSRSKLSKHASAGILQE